MKLIFLGASFRIIWFMRVHKAVRRTYNKEQDSFRIEFLVGPCILLALLIHRSFAVIEVRRPCSGTAAVTAARLPAPPPARRSCCGRSRSTWRRSRSCRSWCCSSGRRISTT